MGIKLLFSTLDWKSWKGERNLNSAIQHLPPTGYGADWSPLPWRTRESDQLRRGQGKIRLQRNRRFLPGGRGPKTSPYLARMPNREGAPGGKRGAQVQGAIGFPTDGGNSGNPARRQAAQPHFYFPPCTNRAGRGCVHPTWAEPHKRKVTQLLSGSCELCIE